MVLLVQTKFIHSLVYSKQNTHNISRQLNEKDLTVSLRLHNDGFVVVDSLFIVALLVLLCSIKYSF